MYTFQQTVETMDPAIGAVVVPRKNSGTDRYRKEEVMNLSPVQIICKLYDIAIISAKKKDIELSRRAINELIAALNFDYAETSLGLYRLYDYSKKCLREGKVDEAVNVLQELRSAWAEAFHLGKHAPE
jgi:flagellin-specific chaperone FliS